MRNKKNYATLIAALLTLALMALSVPALAATSIAPKGEWVLPRDYTTTKTYPTAEDAKAGTNNQEYDDWPLFFWAWKVVERQGTLVRLVYAPSQKEAEEIIAKKENISWGIADQWVPLTEYVNDPANAENTLHGTPKLRSFTAPLDAAKGQDNVTFSMLAVPTARSAGIMIEAKAKDGTLLWSGFPVPMLSGDGMESAFYTDTFCYIPELVADFSGKGKAGIIAGQNRHEMLAGTFRLYEWDGNTFAKRDSVVFYQKTLAKGADPTVLKRLPDSENGYDGDAPFAWIDQWLSREADGTFRVMMLVGPAEKWYTREALVKGDPFAGDMTFVRWLGEVQKKAQD